LFFMTRRIQINMPTGTPIEMNIIPKAAMMARMYHEVVLQSSP
jgi:hypothetical protein